MDADEIRDEPLARALGERYLAYALSTIMNRALPDVRDGLKPVHRRLLYAMRQLKLDPGSGFKKCARVVGDVIGKYHPHGDQAVYDALVRLAQDFAARYPLIDGQGNFGNIDGDGAAAMRYTESRLTAVADWLLRDIDEETVEFRPTYDGEDAEPEVLPGAFPNLLANGAAGIAVGMATSIPPHNAAEVCNALLHLLKTPGAREDTFLKHIPGPDFPTGGVIVESREAIAEAYRTGRGGFRVRARWEVEKGERGSYVVVVTEMPYQVQKAKLVEKIAELMLAKKLPLLGDIRDESAEDIRLVLEPKTRTVEPELLMEGLFRATDLETRVPLNMNVLDKDHTPRVMSLAEVLRAFLDHRREVVIRRSRFRLEKAERRIEVLEGYLIVYLNLDEVIRIIREEDEPKPALMEAFNLSEVQAEAILNMRLRSLRKLEEMELKREHKALKSEAKALRALIKSEDKQWAAVGEEVKAVRDAFGPKTELGRRRTQFAEAPDIEDVPQSMLVEREPITVVLSEKGWIRALKGHLEGDAELKFKEGDALQHLVRAETTDKLLVFATNGRFYTLPCDRLPGGRGHGEPIRLMMDLGNDEAVLALFVHNPERTLLVASETGRGFLVPEAELVGTKRGGKQVLNLAEGEEARLAVPSAGDHVAVIGDNRKLLLFPLAEVPTMTRGRGVLLQRYKDGGLADARVFMLSEGLTYEDARGRSMQLEDPGQWLGTRAQAGRMVPKGFPRSGRFSPKR